MGRRPTKAITITARTGTLVDNPLLSDSVEIDVPAWEETPEQLSITADALTIEGNLSLLRDAPTTVHISGRERITFPTVESPVSVGPQGLRVQVLGAQAIPLLQGQVILRWAESWALGPSIALTQGTLSIPQSATNGAALRLTAGSIMP